LPHSGGNNQKLCITVICDESSRLETLRVTWHHGWLMPVYPTPEEKSALCEVVVQFVARGPIERPVVQFLFRESIRMNDEPTHISEGHILEGCKDGPSTEGALRALLTRLRKDLADFFSGHSIGRQQRYRVVIPLREYALSFEINDPPPMSGDLVKSFWAPYYTSDRPTRIFYPEPQFFADAKETHLYHPDATTAVQAKNHFSHLNVKGELAQDFPFVPSGIVQAMATIFECLQRPPRAPVTAIPIRPAVPFPEQDEDIVVLGTFATMPHLSGLEAGCPLHTGSSGILSRQAQGKTRSFKDNCAPPQTPSDALVSVWALLTRNFRRYQGRVVTTLSANTSRAVEALAAFLTRQQELHSLAQSFESDYHFPDRFQVLFEISLFYPEAEPHVHHIAPKLAIDLDSVPTKS
jgi:hypothetical protein